jgi:hypothetical protein
MLRACAWAKQAQLQRKGPFLRLFRPHARARGDACQRGRNKRNCSDFVDKTAQTYETLHRRKSISIKRTRIWQRTDMNHRIFSAFLGAIAGATCILLLKDDPQDREEQRSFVGRKLLVNQHYAHHYNINHPQPHRYAVTEYFRALYSTQAYPSQQFSVHNTYYDTRKRFWRAPTTLCTYDKEDEANFKSDPQALTRLDEAKMFCFTKKRSDRLSWQHRSLHRHQRGPLRQLVAPGDLDDALRH